MPITATISVPAYVPVDSVEAIELRNVSGRARYGAIARDAGNNQILGRRAVWSSSNPAVATVDSMGSVTPLSDGTTVLTVTIEGESDTVNLTVNGIVPMDVSTVSVAPSSFTVSTGSTQQLTATPRDINGLPLPGRVVTWVSSAPSIASVNSSGLVTGVAAGSATITATCEGVTGTASGTVTGGVTPVVTTVTVAPASPTIADDGTQQFTATVRDQSGNVMAGQAVTWTSGTPGIATINSSGLATAVADGTTTITATSVTDNTKSGTATLTVSSSAGTPATLTSVGNGFKTGSNFSDAETPQDVVDTFVAIGNQEGFVPAAGRITLVTDPTYGQVPRLSFVGAPNPNRLWFYLDGDVDDLVPNLRFRVLMKFAGIANVASLANTLLFTVEAENSDPYRSIEVGFNASSQLAITPQNVDITGTNTGNTTEAAAIVAGGWREYIVELNNNGDDTATLNIYANAPGATRTAVLSVPVNTYVDANNPSFDGLGIMFFNVPTGITLDLALVENCDVYDGDGDLIPVANMGS